MHEINAWWCDITQYELERTDYSKIIFSTVNDYLAIMTNGEIKKKVEKHRATRTPYFVGMRAGFITTAVMTSVTSIILKEWDYSWRGLALAVTALLISLWLCCYLILKFEKVSEQLWLTYSNFLDMKRPAPLPGQAPFPWRSSPSPAAPCRQLNLASPSRKQKISLVQYPGERVRLASRTAQRCCRRLERSSLQRTVTKGSTRIRGWGIMLVDSGMMPES